MRGDAQPCACASSVAATMISGRIIGTVPPRSSTQSFTMSTRRRAIMRMASRASSGVFGRATWLSLRFMGAAGGVPSGTPTPMPAPSRSAPRVPPRRTSSRMSKKAAGPRPRAVTVVTP